MELLDIWRAHMTAQGLSHRTITERVDTIRRLQEHTDCDLHALTEDHIIAYLGRPGTTAITKATYHASIRAFCKWMVRSRRRADDPTVMMIAPRRPKGQPRPIHATSLEALLNACNRRRTRTYVILAAYTGLRVHEIAKLRGDDIDPYSGVLTVRGKGGKIAQLPLHPAVLDEARHYPSMGWWFPSYRPDDQGPVGPHAVSKAIRDAMHRAGFHAKPHQLRHYFATELLQAGVDIRVVQTLMRHESTATTEIYTRVDVRQQQDAIARLTLPRLAA